MRLGRSVGAGMRVDVANVLHVCAVGWGVVRGWGLGLLKRGRGG